MAKQTFGPARVLSAREQIALTGRVVDDDAAPFTIATAFDTAVAKARSGAARRCVSCGVTVERAYRVRPTADGLCPACDAGE